MFVVYKKKFFLLTNKSTADLELWPPFLLALLVLAFSLSVTTQGKGGGPHPNNHQEKSRKSSEVGATPTHFLWTICI